MKQELEKLRTELNERIDLAIKELTPPSSEFEVGKWYYFERDDGDSFLAKFSRLDEYRFYYSHCAPLNYHNMVWAEDDWCNVSLLKRPATKEEVESALIKEAEKRGFKEGVEIMSFFSNLTPYVSPVKLKQKDKWKYKSDEDSLHHEDGARIYCKGKWAEIVKDSPIKIGGYEMKVEGDAVKFGCKNFSKVELEHLHDIMMENDFTTVHFNNYEPVSLDTINAILEKLK